MQHSRAGWTTVCNRTISDANLKHFSWRCIIRSTTSAARQQLIWQHCTSHIYFLLLHQFLQNSQNTKQPCSIIDYSYKQKVTEYTHMLWWKSFYKTKPIKRSHDKIYRYVNMSYEHNVNKHQCTFIKEYTSLLLRPILRSAMDRCHLQLNDFATRW